MKRIVLLLCALIGFADIARAASIPISLTPASQAVVVGTNFDISIDVADLVDGGAPSIGVFDFDFMFDPGSVSFQGVTWGTELDLFGLGDLQASTPSAGVLNLFELSLESAFDLNVLQSGAFSLAIVRFTALGVGTPTFGLLVNAFGDADGAALDFSVAGARVDIAADPDIDPTPVPEPTTLFMVGAGAAVVRFRRVRRANI